MGAESDGFGTQDLEANTEFRQSAFLRTVGSGMVEVGAGRGRNNI